MLKDAKRDPFVQANLAAAYAKALAGRKVYEEALDALKGVQPEQLVDPAGFYFHKAVAEHALIQREAAVGSIARLLDDVPDAPDRYRMVATLMFFDIQNWSKDEKDLSNIDPADGQQRPAARPGPRRPEDPGHPEEDRLPARREDQGTGGPEEEPAGPATAAACPTGGQPGNGGGGEPERADGGQQHRHQRRQGRRSTRRSSAATRRTGASCPRRSGKKIIQEVARDLPPKYKPMIEDYFRSLNRMHGYKNP